MFSYILRLIKNRKVQMILVDCALLVIAHMSAFFMATTFGIKEIDTEHALLECAAFTLFNVASLFLFKGYDNIWRYAKIKEFIDCIVAVVAGSSVYFVTMKLANIKLNEIYVVLSSLFAAFEVVVMRFVYHYVRNKININTELKKERTLIVGAGDACNEIINEMQNSQFCNYKPVVIVDDEEGKLNRRINSIPIEGTTADIPKLVEKYRIKTIIFAIPSCSAEDKNRIMSICAETNCIVKKIPYLHEIIEVDNLLSQIRPIRIDDLLERDVIKLDNPKLSETISGKVCMVTGGGGSIGSELSRQIAKNKPKTLIIVDIYENNAYDIQQELVRKYKDALDLRIEIASVRDKEKMEKLFKKYSPQLVFHAAAHKHVPLMETNPEEAIKNNIFGTYNTAELAEKYGAEKFVLVSTDKAVNPTNVMGATKRCCEMVVQYMAQKKSATEFIAVRFGNVLGSNGSVIPLFERQIAENKPITVTHPDIIRYFMTIPEAVFLILEAATIARGGEIFVLDMGKPVKILTLAENLIRMHGKEPYTEVKIEFTGLRPGEKLYEELLMDEEGLRSTANDRIFVGKQIKVDADEFVKSLKDLEDAAQNNNTDSCVETLKKVVPTFVHKEIEKKEAVS